MVFVGFPIVVLAVRVKNPFRRSQQWLVLVTRSTDLTQEKGQVDLLGKASQLGRVVQTDVQ